MKPAITATAVCLAAASLAACASVTFPPAPVTRAKGYDGPTLPESEVATVFILDGRPRYESGYICQVDGRPATAQGGCASVVYLRPGPHQLSIRYQSPTEVGEGQTGLEVEAGRLYQLNATSFRTRNRGMISVMPMPAGARLTHRNVARACSRAARPTNRCPTANAERRPDGRRVSRRPGAPPAARAAPCAGA